MHVCSFVVLQFVQRWWWQFRPLSSWLNATFSSHPFEGQIFLLLKQIALDAAENYCKNFKVGPLNLHPLIFTPFTTSKVISCSKIWQNKIHLVYEMQMVEFKKILAKFGHFLIDFWSYLGLFMPFFVHFRVTFWVTFGTQFGHILAIICLMSQFGQRLITILSHISDIFWPLLALFVHFLATL